MENMGYREGSSKLSKHRRMSRAASLAVEAGEGIPLSRYATQSIRNEKKRQQKRACISAFANYFARVWFNSRIYFTHISICVSF